MTPIAPIEKRTFTQSLNRYFTLTCGILLFLVGSYMIWIAWRSIDETIFKTAVALMGGGFVTTGTWYLYRGKKA